MKAQYCYRRSGKILLMATAAFLVQAWLLAPAHGQKIRSEEETAKILALEKVTVKDGVVSGEVRNLAKHPVREVQLFIRYTWLWADERNPGKTDPGTSTYYMLKETLQPGAKVSFSFTPSPPLPKISGGRFDTSVMISGFTEVIPQKK